MNMRMRRSRMLEKVRAGGVAGCVKLNLADPRVAEIAAMAGFDVIWVDMEHIPTDWSVVENQVRAAKAYDADLMVRIAKGSYSDYVRPLEADAAGIMVPHVMSAEEARRVAWMTRFHPIGRRPLDGGNVDGAYTMIDLPDYMEQANRERFICIQIEDPEPLEELDAIVAVEGIDMIFFGPGDFSQGIGAPGQWDDPRIAEARERIAQVCREHGKIAGTVASLENKDELVEMGYQFLNVGADVIALGQYFSRISEAFGGRE